MIVYQEAGFRVCLRRRRRRRRASLNVSQHLVSSSILNHVTWILSLYTQSRFVLQDYTLCDTTLDAAKPYVEAIIHYAPFRPCS